MRNSTVWIFVAPQATFPAGVFYSLEQAEEWIKVNRLSGVVTEYPIGFGVYDWAVSSGVFKPQPSKVIDGTFIGRFTSAAMPHHHYEEGARVA